MSFRPFLLSLSKRPIWIILAWSLLVHAPGLRSPLLDYHAHRQCQTASMARNYYRHGMHFLTPELDNYGVPQRAGSEFPLYSYLLAMLYQVFGLHEILGRLLSMGLTAWSALFLYAFVKPRLGENTALGSALVMCSIPVHIYFTRTVQPESMALWGFLGFIYFVDRWRNSSHPIDWILAALFGALGPLLKLPFMYLVLGLWLVLIMENRRQHKVETPAGRRPGPIVSSTMAGARPTTCRAFDIYDLGMPITLILSTMAWYHYAKSAPDQVLPLGSAEQWRNLSDAFHWEYWRDQMLSRFPELCTTYSGLLFGFIGAWVLKDFKKNLLWFGWWMVTLAYTGLLGEYGHIHRYTLLPWAPINAVFIAVGIRHAWRWAQGKTNSLRWTGLWALLVLGIPLHAALRIAHWYRVERTYLFRAHDVVNAHSSASDLILTNTRETPVLLYYLDRYGYTVDLDHAQPSEVEALLQQGPKLFVTPTEGSWTRHPQWADFFAKHARLLQKDPDYLIYELASLR